MRGRTYKYMDDNIMYPFGYGLSYGSVDYGQIRLLTRRPRSGNPVEVELDVRNTGDRERDEVVQIYLSTPNAGKGAPNSQLVGFERVHLTPGEAHTVRFTLTPELMREVQEDGQARILPGRYTLTMGAAAPTARTEELGLAQRKISFTL